MSIDGIKGRKSTRSEKLAPLEWLKAHHRPDKGEIRGKRGEDAKILEVNEAFDTRVWLSRVLTDP